MIPAPTPAEPSETIHERHYEFDDAGNAYLSGYKFTTDDGQLGGVEQTVNFNVEFDAWGRETYRQKVVQTGSGANPPQDVMAVTTVRDAFGRMVLSETTGAEANKLLYTYEGSQILSAIAVSNCLPDGRVAEWVSPSGDRNIGPPPPPPYKYRGKYFTDEGDGYGLRAIQMDFVPMVKHRMVGDPCLPPGNPEIWYEWWATFGTNLRGERVVGNNEWAPTSQPEEESLNFVVRDYKPWGELASLLPGQSPSELAMPFNSKWVYESSAGYVLPATSYLTGHEEFAVDAESPDLTGGAPSTGDPNEDYDLLGAAFLNESSCDDAFSDEDTCTAGLSRRPLGPTPIGQGTGAKDGIPAGFPYLRGTLEGLGNGIGALDFQHVDDYLLKLGRVTPDDLVARAKNFGLDAAEMSKHAARLGIAASVISTAVDLLNAESYGDIGAALSNGFFQVALAIIVVTTPVGWVGGLVIVGVSVVGGEISKASGRAVGEMFDPGGILAPELPPEFHFD